jgi:hypothetical protein
MAALNPIALVIQCLSPTLSLLLVHIAGSFGPHVWTHKSVYNLGQNRRHSGDVGP